MSSPHPSSIFLCNADDESAEQPSDDTATMIDSEIQSEDGNFRPETTPTDTPIPPRPSHLEHPGNKNIRHGGDLMHEEEVPMTHPVDIVLQLLGPACLLLCELHQVLRLKPSEFPKVFNAQAVCVHKECIATKQGYIDVVFGGNIVGIGDLAHKGLEDRFGDSKALLLLTSFIPQTNVQEPFLDTPNSRVPHAEHEEQTSTPADGVPMMMLVADSLKKPSLNDRDYRVIRLNNEPEALRMHDSETDKVSAALDINVGNFSDESDISGTAHAVEHFFLMGTEKFSIENEYSQCLSANSGSSNAYSGPTSMNYFFYISVKPDNGQDPSDTNPSPLSGALDRFAQELNLYFPFIDEEFMFATQPSRYISHLIGHEGPGSIMSYIRSKGWANGLNAGAYPMCPGTPGIFDMQVRLTEDGLKNYPEIVKIFFPYIALLPDVDFKFKLKTPASRFTSRISSVMQKTLPREWLLSGHSRLREFAPDQIEKALATIRPDNSCMVIVSRNYPGDWD
ncbi:Peptidase M16, middle/third domain [Fusarium oxysporum f. sp. vasinfectum]|nr:Peptidase M16, middle/third domain [Fusarium oxysporum f. sp. vasinfectum]